MTQQTYTPDWSKAPPQANWWARDKDGSGFWYSKRPSAHRHSFIADGYFVAADNDCPFIDCSFELDNWRDTLTVRPFQDRDIPQNLSDYFTGKTPFITAYVDLLLARMAKEDRFSEVEFTTESDNVEFGDIITLQVDGRPNFAVVNQAYDDYINLTNITELHDGDWLPQNYYFIHQDKTILRRITELEAVEFRKAMEAVYG